MSSYTKHLHSSFHLRSDDRKDLFPENTPVDFSSTIHHFTQLEETYDYFLTLNSISIPKKALRGPFHSDFELNYHIVISTGDPLDKPENKPINSAVTERWEKRGPNLECFGKINTRYLFEKHVKTHPTPHRHDYYMNDESRRNFWIDFLKDTSLGTYIAYNDHKYDQIFISRGEIFSVGPILDEVCDRVELTMTEYLIQALKMSVEYSRSYMIVSEHSTEFGKKSLGFTPLSGPVFLRRALEHIYVECSIVEGEIINQKSRKILKVIPIQLCDTQPDKTYFSYEPVNVEPQKIASNSIETIKFQLTDEKGEPIGKDLLRLNTFSPTLISCSIIE